MKRGRMSKVDEQYIADNAHSKSYVQIAHELDREPSVIKNFIEKRMGLKTTLATEARPVRASNPLENKPFWPIISKQFSTEELDLFAHKWNEIMSQFDNDVLPTEESQVLDIIKMEILMDRNLDEQKEIRELIQLLKWQLENSDPADAKIRELIQSQLLSYSGASGQLKKEYREMQTTKQKLLDDIRGTRADRIKTIESKAVNFQSWIENIMRPDKKKELGIYAEKMRLAMIDETVRLAAYHKYEDGFIDQPLLSADTVKHDNE